MNHYFLIGDARIHRMITKAYKKRKIKTVSMHKTEDARLALSIQSRNNTGSIGRLATLLSSLLSVREVWGSIPEPVQSNSVSYSSPLLRRFFGAVLPRRLAAEMDPSTRYTLRRNTASPPKT